MDPHIEKRSASALAFLLSAKDDFHEQEEYYGKEVCMADREMVESQVDAILQDAYKEDVAFLVVGDPFG